MSNNTIVYAIHIVLKFVEFNTSQPFKELAGDFQSKDWLEILQLTSFIITWKCILVFG